MRDIKSFVAGKADDYFPNMGTKNLLMDNAPLESFYADGYHWAGLKKSEILSHYKNLKALGVQQKEYYIVRFKAYKNNSLKDMPLIANPLSGWLATSVSWPILQVDSDTKRVGNYSYSHVTGRQMPDLTINMIETTDNLVLESIVLMRNAMFNKDGTFKAPSEYAVWAEMCLFNRTNGMANFQSRASALVYPSAAAIDVDASDKGALILPITFSRTRPFMPF